MIRSVALGDVTVSWMYPEEEPTAYVYLFGDLVAAVAVGDKPGYCRFALKDGPLAKRLILDPAE